MRISGSTALYGIIGYPVEHSLSPAIHNAAINELSLDAVYVAFSVKPDGLAKAVDGLRVMGVRGFNVTMPFKAEVMVHLDALDDEAAAVKAVNTVVNDDGKLIGYNTDGVGALEALRRAVGEVSGLDIVVVGAGGAARALVSRLSGFQCDITVLSRDPGKAKLLVENFKGRANANIAYGDLSLQTQRKVIPRARLIINATPVGMTVPGCPIDPGLIHSGHVVFDMIYWPPETQLLREARLKGASTLNGLSMLVHQAAHSFNLWFKMAPPVEVMFRAAWEGLLKWGEAGRQPSQR
ncbi:MAG: shikimate dehydrogenase [Candidatus Nezhaarchaeota archaeon]|nr:shikimate dehydrogenase [Candidatus Nezhaarchaeota archaeon]